MKDYVVVVITETDTLFRRAHAAAAKLGDRLRHKRQVLMAAKKFSERVAKHPSSLRVEDLDAVGFCSPDKDHPGKLEPVVYHDGAFKPVSHSFASIAGEYRLLPKDDVPAGRARIVESCGRTLAHRLFIEEAMTAAVDALDPEMTLEGMSCNAATFEVWLDGDDDGRIAKRLPRWIKIEKPGGLEHQAHAQATPSSSAVKASATARTYNSSR
jgi:hypothetical protein